MSFLVWIASMVGIWYLFDVDYLFLALGFSFIWAVIKAMESVHNGK